MEIQIRTWSSLNAATRQQILMRSETDIAGVRDRVAEIIRRVRAGGDQVLRSLTSQFDHADISRLPLRVSPEEFDAAERSLSAEVRAALEFSVENVRRYHAHQLPNGLALQEVRRGIYAGERAAPIPSAGLYVPRGRGSFPSMLYMLAVPAALAGVERVCIATPPNPDGTVDAACLAAARLCGVTEVYRMGGAQAISAFAYGTESVQRVAKIVGPGSMYVTAAQRLVAADVEVGLPAGPTESIVLADASADPRLVALDLLIEAEHGSDSTALLVTDSTKLAEAVAAEVARRMPEIPEPRRTFTRDVLTGYGGALLFDSLEEAIGFVNEFAPEHVQIQTADPFAALSRVRHAGEILLGRRTPFSAANYAVGANAVLPTGGKARTTSSVSVRDFLTFTSVVYLTEDGYRAVEPHVIALADYEGFYNHAQALRDRTPASGGNTGS